MPNPLVIVIDGIIGAGKTELINKCLVPILSERGYRITVIPEPVNKWKESGILERFYEDPKRWAYHFQTKAFLDRVNLSNVLYRKYRDVTDIFILERSIFTDNLFMEVLHDSKTIDDLEYDDYKEWWSMWSNVMPFEPDIFVYLRPSIDECMNRVSERDRGGEILDDTKGVTKSYQSLLLEKHDAFLGGRSANIGECHHIPVVKLETDENFRDDEGVKHRISDTFEEIISHLRSR